jgi:hypothetical protein
MIFTEVLNIQIQLPPGAEERLRGRTTWQEIPDGTFRNTMMVDESPFLQINYTPTTRIMLVTPGCDDFFPAENQKRKWLLELLGLTYKIAVEEMHSLPPRPLAITLRSKAPVQEVRTFMAPAVKNRGVDLWKTWLCPFELKGGAKGIILRIGKGKRIPAEPGS